MKNTGQASKLSENINEIEFDCGEGEALQLVRFNRKEGKFELVPQTAEVGTILS